MVRVNRAVAVNGRSGRVTKASARQDASITQTGTGRPASTTPDEDPPGESVTT